ncbi:hypothetical protein MZD04_gp225 [Pseudomonas phage Psa21]|uniref:Uncharacterized protein n=1 Tax=Pseudomonas phage Psa21 TaxID=2530023 RepID=A0A481W4P9_9CAUD|nr:hypothetical protein MZD04_gp225 [Pseudomonas phage Psa21]QBJ02751.1 hypothetical protein PSA21_225 [Pseudomonas phage Psa21]
MSTVYSLEVFAKRYELTIAQLFDRSWMLYDIYSMPINYRGRPITFINEGTQIPSCFEVSVHRNGTTKRFPFLTTLSELTVSQDELDVWFRKVRPNYYAHLLCSYDHGLLASILAHQKDANSLLCWHITNRLNMIQDGAVPEPIPSDTGFIRSCYDYVMSTSVAKKIFS